MEKSQQFQVTIVTWMFRIIDINIFVKKVLHDKLEHPKFNGFIATRIGKG